MSDLMTVTVTQTDTFCGEPNYGWVERHEFQELSGASRRTLVMKAKKLCGLTGVLCDVEDYGDELTIRPHGVYRIVFVACTTTEGTVHEN